MLQEEMEELESLYAAYDEEEEYELLEDVDADNEVEKPKKIKIPKRPLPKSLVLATILGLLIAAGVVFMRWDYSRYGYSVGQVQTTFNSIFTRTKAVELRIIEKTTVIEYEFNSFNFDGGRRDNTEWHEFALVGDIEPAMQVRMTGNSRTSHFLIVEYPEPNARHFHPINRVRVSESNFNAFEQGDFVNARVLNIVSAEDFNRDGAIRGIW